MKKGEILVIDKKDIHFEEFTYKELFSKLYKGKMVIAEYSDGRRATVMQYDREKGKLLSYSMSQSIVDPHDLCFKLVGTRRKNIDEFFAECVAWASILKEWSVVVGWPE